MGVKVYNQLVAGLESVCVEMLLVFLYILYDLNFQCDKQRVWFRV